MKSRCDQMDFYGLKQKIFVLLSFLCLVGALSSDSALAAGSISGPESYTGSLGKGGMDRFEFHAKEGEVVHMRIIPSEGSDLRLSIWLYAPDGTLVSHKDVRHYTGAIVAYNCNEKTEDCFNQTGSYYFVITDNRHTGHGDYTILVMRPFSSSAHLN